MKWKIVLNSYLFVVNFEKRSCDNIVDTALFPKFNLFEQIRERVLYQTSHSLVGIFLTIISFFIVCMALVDLIFQALMMACMCWDKDTEEKVKCWYRLKMATDITKYRIWILTIKNANGQYPRLNGHMFSIVIFSL